MKTGETFLNGKTVVYHVAHDWSVRSEGARLVRG